MPTPQLAVAKAGQHRNVVPLTQPSDLTPGSAERCITAANDAKVQQTFGKTCFEVHTDTKFKFHCVGRPGEKPDRSATAFGLFIYNFAKFLHPYRHDLSMCSSRSPREEVGKPNETDFQSIDVIILNRLGCQCQHLLMYRHVNIV